MSDLWLKISLSTISRQSHPHISDSWSPPNLHPITAKQSLLNLVREKRREGQECFRSEGGVCLPAAEAAWQEQVSYYNSFSQFSLSADRGSPLTTECPLRPPRSEEPFSFITQQRTKTTSPGRARQLKVTLAGSASSRTFTDSLTITRPLE